MLGIFILISLVFGFSGTAVAYSYGDPSEAEQVHLEAINRARANPQQEANRLGFDVFEGTDEGAISDASQPPLALNAQLSQAALLHSQEMATNNYLDHFSLNGDAPQDRIMAEGYTDLAYSGENVAFRATSESIDVIADSIQLHEDLYIDEDYPKRAHRVNILSPDFKEIGIGLVQGTMLHDSGVELETYYVTTDFATHAVDTRNFIVGVVYDDSNADQQYSAGEGLANVTIEVLESNDSTQTATAGGYGLALSDGSYTLHFSRADLGQVSRSVMLSGNNVKVDVLLSDFVNDTTGNDGSTIDDDLSTPSTVTDNQGTPSTTDNTEIPICGTQQVLVGTINQNVHVAPTCVTPPTLNDNFSGGFSVTSNVDYTVTGGFTFGSFVSIIGQFNVPTVHQGRAAEIIVFAGHRDPILQDNDPTVWYTLDTTRRDDGNADYHAFEQQLNREDLLFTDLRIYQTIDSLAAQHGVPLWSGGVVRGTLEVYFGYRLVNGDGSLFVNTTPIFMTIE